MSSEQYCANSRPARHWCKIWYGDNKLQSLPLRRTNTAGQRPWHGPQCVVSVLYLWDYSYLAHFTCSLSGMLILCIWLQISIIHHSNLSEPISSLFSRVFASNRNFHFYSPLTKQRITLILHSRITSFSFGVFPNIRIYVRSITDNESLNFCVRWWKFTSPDLALFQLWMNLSFLTEIKVSKLQVRM